MKSKTHHCLVVWNIFFHILGISSSQLINIFQRGRSTNQNDIEIIKSYQDIGQCIGGELAQEYGKAWVDSSWMSFRNLEVDISNYAELGFFIHPNSLDTIFRE